MPTPNTELDPVSHNWTKYYLSGLRGKRLSTEVYLLGLNSHFKWFSHRAATISSVWEINLDYNKLQNSECGVFVSENSAIAF